MNPSRSARRFISCCRDFGADEVLLRTLTKMSLISRYHSLDIFFMELLTPFLNSIPKVDVTDFLEVEFREISKDEISSLEFSEGLPPTAECQKRFQQGGRLFAAIENETILAIKGAPGA